MCRDGGGVACLAVAIVPVVYSLNRGLWIGLGVLIGGLWLRFPVSRILLILLAIPVAIVINAIRVFLTGFLVYFVSAEMGEAIRTIVDSRPAGSSTLSNALGDLVPALV